MVIKIKNPDPEDWSPTWKRSKQPRKQRKYIYNAPKHVRRKLMAANLSKEIRELLKKRSLPIKVGDYVKILRGKFRGKEGYVFHVDTKNYRVYVDTAYIEKKNGEKSYYPLHPSKLLITKLNLTDMRRVERIAKVKGLSDNDLKNLMKISITDKDELKKIYELNSQFK